MRRMTSDYTDTPLWQQILRFVAPITATYALEGAATLVPIWAAAHGGNPTEAEATRRVGAVGLGNTVVICVALVVKSGWTGAQDTLVSQAHGLKDHRKARDHLNCCQIWMVFLAAICSLLLLSTEQMLILTGCATEQLAADTFRYVLSCIPGVWLEFQYDALRKFLMNQQIPSPGFWVLVGAVPAHWAMCVVLLNQIHVCDPLVAIGIAFSVKSAVSFLLLAGYMSFLQPTPSCIGWWRIWSCSAGAGGLASYATIAVPSVAMYGFDWWAYEMLTLLAGGLRSDTQLAAHVAATTASDWAFLVVRGAPKAATALVGAAAGREDVGRVRKVVRACLLLTFVMCSGLSVSCWFGRQHLTHMLLPDERETQAIFGKLLVCVLLSLLADGFNSCCSGIFAGLGRQGAVSAGLFAFQWVVQLPLACFLGYHFDMGALGLHVASCVASVLNSVYNALLMKHCIKDFLSVLDVLHSFCSFFVFSPLSVASVLSGSHHN
ncbi:Multidrug and toxin extrusion protein 1 (MATE-1) (mMATE-1) (Solute carrier family 47 member 1) [Durusdinium trenchii]|uniref:Multidrug and toxin extrusion protein 1 (MATE-1) (MMATE-1) (Solute carrier family 47 member 1) n=1 Tax=Durusdinium trenchii TaxID=1381693 RepID=A0ABP0HM60_9DINO